MYEEKFPYDEPQAVPLKTYQSLDTARVAIHPKRQPARQARRHKTESQFPVASGYVDYCSGGSSINVASLSLMRPTARADSGVRTVAPSSWKSNLSDAAPLRVTIDQDPLSNLLPNHSGYDSDRARDSALLQSCAYARTSN